MRFIQPITTRAAASLLLALAFISHADPLPPRPAPAAGAGAKTLVIFSQTHTPYSLADDLAALRLELRRVVTRVEVVAATQADSNSLAGADYIVVFNPQPYPGLSDGLLQALAQTPKPVLWVGYGAEELGKQPAFLGQFDVVSFAAPHAATSVTYRGRDWNQSFASWMPVRLASTNSGQVIMSVPITETNSTTVYPVAWKSGHVTFFSALPTATATSPLFCDLLLDYYGATGVSNSEICVRIDGYQCHQNHQEFRHLVDYLHGEGIPFAVGVVPAFWNPDTKKVDELETQPEFVAALRYAQQNGGSLILQGYANARQAATGQDEEFWDGAQDRPYADDSAEYVRERMEQAMREMLSKGLVPVGWETPYNAASRVDYAEIAKDFSMGVERTQLSDSTSLENFAGPAVTEDDFGRLIVPENLGAVTGDKAALVQIRDRAELITPLRGTVATVTFPAYLTEDKLKQAVSLLQRSQRAFADIGAGDNWIQLPDVVVLSGNARRTATVNNARITWRAFDRAGNQLAIEVGDKPVSGEQLFQRRGKGDYEVFEINEANQ